VVTIIAGFVVAISLALTSTSRGLRAIATPLWLIGIMTLFAAMKGMCVVLHGLHHYHVRPWELWNDDEDFEKAQESKLSFGSDETNSYEDEVRRTCPPSAPTVLTHSAALGFKLPASVLPSQNL
jgi:hypothetical protein